MNLRLHTRSPESYPHLTMHYLQTRQEKTHTHTHTHTLGWMDGWLGGLIRRARLTEQTSSPYKCLIIPLSPPFYRHRPLVCHRVFVAHKPLACGCLYLSSLVPHLRDCSRDTKPLHNVFRRIIDFVGW